MLSGGIGLCTLCVSAILVTLLMAGCGNGTLIDEPEKLYTTLQRLTFGTVSEPQLTWSDVIFDTLRGQVHNVAPGRNLLVVSRVRRSSRLCWIRPCFHCIEGVESIWSRRCL